MGSDFLSLSVLVSLCDTKMIVTNLVGGKEGLENPAQLLLP